MPTAVLALLLFAASVDPRLEEPLNLLAEVGARETADGMIGTHFASLPESLGLSLIVTELRSGVAGRYHPRIRAVEISRALVDEDPRALASVLAHELQHALDIERIALDLLEPDCLALEARGFEAQSIVARTLWPDELPRRTKLERNLSAVVRIYERGGLEELQVRLETDAVYSERCAVWRG